MKSKQLSLFALIASVYVLIATAAPMDAPSRPNRQPQLLPATADQVQPTSATDLVDPSENVRSMMEKQLTIANSASPTQVFNRHQEVVKATDHPADAQVGSKDGYVTDIAFCAWLNDHPEQKKVIKTIYVTSEVFMECGFNPTDFPVLRNVNIHLKDKPYNNRHSHQYMDLLDDPGFKAMIETKWKTEDHFKLNTFQSEWNLVPLEQYLIETEKMDWVEFLLKHRDWESLNDPFHGLDELLYTAIVTDNTELIPLLYRIDEKYSLRQGRDPYALDLTIMRGKTQDEWFRGHVNEAFMNVLIDLRSGNVEGVKKWLSGDPTSEQVSRVFAALLLCSDIIGLAAANLERMLMYDPRLDLKHRDLFGRPLIYTAIKNNRWEVFDFLISMKGIQVNVPDSVSYGTLFLAMAKKISPQRFHYLLERGANTFDTVDFFKTPFMTALERGQFEFAMAILEKRIVGGRGDVEFRMTEKEKEALDGSVSFRRMVGDIRIRIVHPQ